ncbi:MAG: hypothetical protein ACJ780_17985 [Solirubrobacteraceae bacterium]
MELRGVVVVEDQGCTDGAVQGRRVDAFEEVANRPIIHHVLAAVRGAGAEKILLVGSDQTAGGARECLGAIPVDGTSIEFISHPAPIDMAAGLRLAAEAVGDAPCIVHAANVLLDEPLAPYLGRLRGAAPRAMAFVHQAPLAAHGRLNMATLQMLRLAELDPDHAAFALAGVWLFGPNGLNSMMAAPWQANGHVDLTVLAERMHTIDGKFDVVTVDSCRRYAGDPLDLLELNRIALEALHADVRRPPGNGNHIEGRVWIHETATVSSSVIVGPTVIGPDAHIADAYIGPYTSIGAGARIEGAEIERSIIAARASVLHVGGRIVASVVGRDARVFRDFSLPRALRLRVGDGTEVALC